MAHWRKLLSPRFNSFAIWTVFMFLRGLRANMSYNDDRRKQRVKPTSSQHVSDWPDRTVQIEPGLRSRSPKNGNISNIRRRLSAVPGQKGLIPERGNRLPIRKSPPLAAIF